MSRGEQGSVFVEALVATAILAMILGAAFQVTSQSAQRRRMVEARRYALMVARSQLAAIGSATPLTGGALEGRDGDQVWRMEANPCPDAPDTGRDLVLYCVAVSVREATGGPPLVTLTSRRLAPQA